MQFAQRKTIWPTSITLLLTSDWMSAMNETRTI